MLARPCVPTWHFVRSILNGASAAQSDAGRFEASLVVEVAIVVVAVAAVVVLVVVSVVLFGRLAGGASAATGPAAGP